MFAYAYLTTDPTYFVIHTSPMRNTYVCGAVRIDHAGGEVGR